MTLTSGVADAVSAVTVDRMMLESSFVRDESNKQKEKEERKKNLQNLVSFCLTLETSEIPGLRQGAGEKGGTR